MEIIIVAPCHVPLVIGGAERLWWGLTEHLNRRTPHVADLIKLPGPERDFWEVVDSYRRFSELDLRHYELVVSTKYPSWMIEHPRHVCYMQHPLRGLYDTYPAHLPRRFETRHPSLRGLLDVLRGPDHSRSALRECFERLEGLKAPRRFRAPVPSDAFAFPGPLIREVVQFCDRVAFAPGAIARYCAISETVAGREDYFPADAEVVAVPHPSDLEGFREPEPGRYFFTVSRLDRPKRIDLMIEAVRSLGPEVQLHIAGTGPDEPRLRQLAEGDPRIRFLGFVGDDVLLDLYAHATAVLFTPYDEDLGLVALEAMSAAKPVVTTADSGGTAALVHEGVTGLIAAPEPEAIAAAMQRLHGDREWAARLGANGRREAAKVSWDNVCRALLDGLS